MVVNFVWGGKNENETHTYPIKCATRLMEVQSTPPFEITVLHAVDSSNQQK
jgi:hypothetical protein